MEILEKGVPFWTGVFAAIGIAVCICTFSVLAYYSYISWEKAQTLNYQSGYADGYWEGSALALHNFIVGHTRGVIDGREQLRPTIQIIINAYCGVKEEYRNASLRCEPDGRGGLVIAGDALK